ncbi:YhcH/YjgK/YiaL family protein [Desulfovibrio sp. OttesenSCG-928-O18]|nr:YhcH/YjgK/YiaL family protein [Desulfovibrio sp. OttesenSCG-928-O18]
MMYGTVAQWKRDKAYFPAAFDKAFGFLNGKDVLRLAPGRYDIDGDKVFALLQDVPTEDETLRRFEAHAKYIDIQLLLTGREKQLYAPASSGLEITEDRLAQDDVVFYTRPASYNSVFLEPWSYAVYLAGELHVPCCAATLPGETVRKIVFKIARE